MITTTATANPPIRQRESSVFRLAYCNKTTTKAVPIKSAAVSQGDLVEAKSALEISDVRDATAIAYNKIPKIDKPICTTLAVTVAKAAIRSVTNTVISNCIQSRPAM